jgi:hypothetical protein
MVRFLNSCPRIKHNLGPYKIYEFLACLENLNVI